MNANSPSGTDCSGSRTDYRCKREKNRGVLLINLGTPDDCDPVSVRRYLSEFLSDPHVIKLPRWLRWMNRPLGWLIARLRAKTSAGLYRNIWDDRGSPLKFITEDQAVALEATLSDDWRVYIAMRYGNPSIGATLDRIVEAGITNLIVIPMYPQYSGPTTGTALSVLYKWLEQHEMPINVEIRNIWYNDAGYIEAQAQLIHDFAREHGLNADNAFLLYSTHSMPQSYIDDGDPYEYQVRESMRLVNKLLGWKADRTALSFQSKLGPVPWLTPSTEDQLRELVAKGEKTILVCPISFTADCLETLEEIGIGYRRMVKAKGADLVLCPSPNTHDSFIKALSSLVRRGPHPMHLVNREITTLFNGVEHIGIDQCIDDLIMIGVSTEARLGKGEGPGVTHVSDEDFNHAKRPQIETIELLKQLRSENLFRECWIWNTCNRFECYGWLNGAESKAKAEKMQAVIRSRIFGNGTPNEAINVLHGIDAWHHLLRTASGLNSSLPGDVEVIEQLESAHRMAKHAETSGPLTDKVIARVGTVVKNVRDSTTWGDHGQNYSEALISQIFPNEKVLHDAKIVLIGGSVTSHSLLKALGDKFNVDSRQFTLVYRGYRKGRLVKMLRQAVGEGECQLVDDYRDSAVMKTIADADILFMATDHRKPFLDCDALGSIRNLVARPITAIDFNTFGSCNNMDSINGMRIVSMNQIKLEIEVYADALVHHEEFRRSVEQAEQAILRQIDSKTTPKSYPKTRAATCRNQPAVERREPLVGHDGHMSRDEDIRIGLPVIDRDDFQRYAGLSLPRHVSYPMPNWWQPMTGQDAAAMIRQSNENEDHYDLSLYLHIPFCNALCKFCGCNRTILRKSRNDAVERTEAYLIALMREIEQTGKRFPDRKVGQIHWGGGTPTYLSCNDIIRLHKKTIECFDLRLDAEVSIEVDPRVTTHDQIHTLRELGFNRVSMGVQDFDERVQKHIHRVQPFEVVLECVESCREVGMESVNFDLIYGMPYQTLETITETLDKTIELAPDRIAFYHYAQIPEKIANQRGIHHDQMAGSDAKLDMFLLAHKKFVAAGYDFIGLDHFAKPGEGLAEAQRTGQMTRNFQGMTTGRGFDLIGLGASSISQLEGIGYLQNIHSPEEYVQRVSGGVSPIIRGVSFGYDDLIRQSLINDLYCLARVDPDKFEKQFEIDFKTYFVRELDILRELEQDGLVDIGETGSIEVLFPLGRVLMRNVAAVFDAYLDPKSYKLGERHAFSTSA